MNVRDSTRLAAGGNACARAQDARTAFCRSEHARDELKDAAGCQAISVIVDDYRERARFYKGGG